MTPIQEDIEVVGTSPELPSSSLINSLTVNFNRAVTSNDIGAIRMSCKDTSSSSVVNYQLNNGLIETVAQPKQGIGTYSISGNTISLQLYVSNYVISFDLL